MIKSNKGKETFKKADEKVKMAIEQYNDRLITIIELKDKVDEAIKDLRESGITCTYNGYEE